MSATLARLWWLPVLLMMLLAFGILPITASGCKTGTWLNPETKTEQKVFLVKDNATGAWRPVTKQEIADVAAAAGNVAEVISTVSGQPQWVPLIGLVQQLVALILGAWAVQSYRKKNNSDATAAGSGSSPPT